MIHACLDTTRSELPDFSYAMVILEGNFSIPRVCFLCDFCGF